MVAEVTGYNWSHIMNLVPYARGLQAQTVWFIKKGIKCQSAEQANSARNLKTVMN